MIEAIKTVKYQKGDKRVEVLTTRKHCLYILRYGRAFPNAN